MAGLVPAIHVFLRDTLKQDVDARHKAGHGGSKIVSALTPETRRR
jgi:hypothetical protein